MAAEPTVYYRNWTSTDTTAGQSNITNKVQAIDYFGWTAPTGYEFKEWNTQRDGTGTSFQPNDAVSLGSPPLYAIWQALQQDLSKIIIPDGTEYNLKDATARTQIASKQDTLVSGTNIKTINGNSLLGSGDITIQGSGDTVTVQQTLSSGTEIGGVTVNGSQTKLYAPTPPTPSTTVPLMDGTGSYGSGTEYARGNHVHPTDTSRQETLVSGTNIKTINGNSLLGSGDITISGGSAKNVWYGTCGTSAGTQTKVVDTTTDDFTLATGNMVRVKFTNAQTYNGGIKLNVDGTGAENVMRQGTTVTTRYFYLAGEVVDFVYDGTNFIAVNEGIATTTYYGVTKLSNSTASTSTSLAATANAVKLAYDHADSKQDELVSGTNIKTVNNTSLLGSGDVAVQPTLVSGTNIKTVNNTSLLGSGNVAVQPTLVSGTNIKSINGSSILGSGDLTVGGGVQSNWNETDTTSLAYIQNKPQLNVLTATDDGNGNVTLTYTSVASATGVTF